MSSSEDIDDLYKWINRQYMRYTNEDISEEEYLKDLEFYKKKLATLKPETVEKEVNEGEVKKESIKPSVVRSTSIAGLRKKLLEEMKK